MKTLIALAAVALTMFALTASASAATVPNAIGRYGVVQPNPRMFGPIQPNPRTWGIADLNLRGYGGSARQNPHGLVVSSPLGAIGRW